MNREANVMNEARRDDYGKEIINYKHQNKIIRTLAGQYAMTILTTAIILSRVGQNPIKMYFKYKIQYEFLITP